MIIPIDFVAGTHGHFLEIVLNKFFDICPINFEPFNELGASHNVTKSYLESRLFVADHWFEKAKKKLNQCHCAVSIQFDQDDLLLVSSVSLLRAGNQGIHNQELEINTRHKLDNVWYRETLAQIQDAYPFLDSNGSTIPRNVLREFFKFGFADPEINGYWKKQQQMHYEIPVFTFQFKAFYNLDLFVDTLERLENFLAMKFRFDDELIDLHQKFLHLIPYVNNQIECDDIINAVKSNKERVIPPLTLFQESYINAKLENHYRKEMPFYGVNYFTSTLDVLKYLQSRAPNL